MATMILPQAFDLAAQHHQAGRLAEAEQIYRQILTQEPNHPRALRLLGMLASQVDRLDIAIDCLRRAVSVKPDFAEAWLDLGNVLQSAGSLAAAINAFRRLIALKPAFAGGQCNLGNALQASGELEAAIAACRHAIQLQPDLPEAHNNLGNALAGVGKSADAVLAYQCAVSLKPDFSAAHFNLGNAHLGRNELDAAVQCYRRVIALQPGFVPAYVSLARSLRMKGDAGPAIDFCRRAIVLQPNDFDAYQELGRLLHVRGQLDEAIVALTRARSIRPTNTTVHNELGVSLQARGRVSEAIASYRQHLSLTPDDPLGHNNLGAALCDSFQAEEAIGPFQRALELNPAYWEAYSNLGSAWKDVGRVSDALTAFRKSLALNPDSAIVHSKLAYTLNFAVEEDSATIGQECRRWDQRHAEPLKKFIQPHANDSDPDRRLRIAYVSPDFRNQSECYFVLPLLESHDHARFEIHCYASVAMPDAITDRHRRSVDVWHDVLGKTDEELAEQIREDGIDILVDLTMHMASNRLLTMARKPAPVQVCWLAYPGTTGLRTIDYRITDAFMDAPDFPTPHYSESSVRLPNCWVCFDPLSEAPPAALHDAAWSGPIRFGSLNNPCKINEPTLRIWGEVLKAVAGSRCYLLAGSTLQRNDIRHCFESIGIDTCRIEFVDYMPRPDYLRLYDRIDICLDPLPYNGITTTCDALWMGVPVLSMIGSTAAGRAGRALLTCVGLSDLVADSALDLVRIATALANDFTRLAELRATLRQAVQSSPWMDHLKFTQEIEGAYRTMWKAWCAGG